MEIRKRGHILIDGKNVDIDDIVKLENIFLRDGVGNTQFDHLKITIKNNDGSFIFKKIINIEGDFTFDELMEIAKNEKGSGV